MYDVFALETLAVSCLRVCLDEKRTSPEKLGSIFRKQFRDTLKRRYWAATPFDEEALRFIEKNWKCYIDEQLPNLQKLLSKKTLYDKMEVDRANLQEVIRKDSSFSTRLTRRRNNRKKRPQTMKESEAK